MLSIAHLTALDLSPEDFVSAAAAAGFDGVGLRIVPPAHTPQQWPVAGDRRRVRDLRALVEDHGLSVLETEGFAIRPDVDVASMEPGIEAAAELGAKYLLSSGNVPAEPGLVEGYAQLCDLAARYGLNVAMEFMPFRPMASLADAVRVHAKVARPNGKLLVDALHLSRSGGTPADLAAVPARDLAYLHLCDAVAELPAPEFFADEARTGRLYPGEGMLPLSEFVRAHPHLDLSIEAPNARYAHLPGADRVRIAAEVTRRFLAGLH